MDRMKTSGSVACSCIRTRSPSRAPPVYGEVGSIARTATRRPAARAVRTSAVAIVDLPTPGAPVSPTVAAVPVWGNTPADSAGRASSPSSTNEIARAIARGARAITPATTSSTSIWPLSLSTGLRGRGGAGDRVERRAQRHAIGALRHELGGLGRGHPRGDHREVDLLALEPRQQPARGVARPRPHHADGRTAPSGDAQ